MSALYFLSAQAASNYSNYMQATRTAGNLLGDREEVCRHVPARVACSPPSLLSALRAALIFELLRAAAKLRRLRIVHILLGLILRLLGFCFGICSGLELIDGLA